MNEQFIALPAIPPVASSKSKANDAAPPLYREDLARKTRDLTLRIEVNRSLLLSVDEKISKALYEESHHGRDMESYVSVLNDERLRVWSIIRESKAELESIRKEKRRLLTEAGLSERELPIGVDELPCTSAEWNVRLHGIRTPQREEWTEKLMRAALLIPLPGRSGGH